MEIQVGEIQGYPVIYIPERKLVFCKNTIVPLQYIRDVLKSGISVHRLEEKKLTITKVNNIVELGCLVTSATNLNNIDKNIKKYERY